MTADNKNLILAIALSILVIVGYQFFYLKPIADREARIAQQQAQSQTHNQPQPQTQSPQSPSAQVPGTQPTQALTRDQAVASTPRVRIASPDIQGSINLTGAQI